MNVVEIRTDFADIRLLGLESSNREWLMRHGLHQLIKQYRSEFGVEATLALMQELNGYFVPPMVNARGSTV